MYYVTEHRITCKTNFLFCKSLGNSLGRKCVERILLKNKVIPFRTVVERVLILPVRFTLLFISNPAGTYSTVCGKRSLYSLNNWSIPKKESTSKRKQDFSF